MRHGKRFNHLGRKSAHRKAMLANMACSLIQYKRIKTTLAKAKALRKYVEPLITKSKNDTTHSRRIVFSYLKQKQAVTELFGDIASKIVNRAGGYTRILKLSNRLGDNAKMAYIELVDYNTEYITDKPKRKRARRGKKKQLIESDINNDINIEKSIPKEEVASEEAPKEEAAEDNSEEKHSVNEKDDNIINQVDKTDEDSIEDKKKDE